ncbi:MAG: hypothetical protein LC104_03355 [Bacteroidales bacterium]|nr:hypothetical protein [Bacteroidales bacterium]
MTRYGYPLLVLLICLPVVFLTLGVPVPGLDVAVRGARVLDVPEDDQELAWLHTTTNTANWERFVYGVVRAQRLIPGLKVDETRAFRDSSTAVPELVLSLSGQPGHLRIRWYKLSSDAGVDYWVETLARRDPAPLAVIGGGSTDRAVDLARAMNRQEQWHGGRPLLLLTQATADRLGDTPEQNGTASKGPGLLGLYPGRSYRFCFTNRQMADAVLDFVWQNPELRPLSFADIAPLTVCSGLATNGVAHSRPKVFAVEWEDDPFSVDLNAQFRDALCVKLRPGNNGIDGGLPIRFWQRSVYYSVGGQVRPNRYEATVGGQLLQEYRSLPPERSLLVLPAVTTPARRLLGGLADAEPTLGARIVAVSGDGVSLNSVYRDGLYAWPVQSLSVPLVFFTHNNPVAWDEPKDTQDIPREYALEPPNGTEDVLLNTELTRIVTQAAYGITMDNSMAAVAGLVTNPDELATRFATLCPAFFDEHGNRVGGTGEYVVVVRPVTSVDPTVRAADPVARIDVWHRGEDRRWLFVRRVDVDQWRTRSVLTPEDQGRDDEQ